MIENLPPLTEAAEIFSAAKDIKLSPLDIATLVAGATGVGAIMKGSAEYKGINGTEQDEKIAEGASLKIFIGTAAMTVTAVLAGNPRYAAPEALAFTTSGKNWLTNKFPESLGKIREQLQSLPGFEKWSRFIVPVVATSILVGLVVNGNISNVQEALAPLGLASLSTAFEMTPKTDKQKLLYRFLTIFGGSSLIAGSGLDLATSEAMVGKIMSGCFLALNTAYTFFEIKNLISEKTKKVVEVPAE